MVHSFSFRFSFRSLAALVLVWGGLFRPLDAAPADASARTLRVLFIGNSFTNRHTLARIVKDMAEAGHPKLTFEYMSVIYAGRTLADHWKFASQNYIQVATLTAEEQARTIASLAALAAEEPKNGMQQCPGLSYDPGQGFRAPPAEMGRRRPAIVQGRPRRRAVLVLRVRA